VRLCQRRGQVEPGAAPNQGWWYVTPQECVGHYRYSLEGTEESLSRQQARSEAVALLNAFTPYVQAGIVNPRNLVERVAYAYDIQDVDSLLNPAPLPQQPQAAPTQTPQLQAAQQAPTLANGAMQPLQPAVAQGFFGGR